MSTEANIWSRLGSPESIADAAAQSYRGTSLLARWRWLAVCTFVLLPIPLFCIAWAGTFAAMMLAASTTGALDSMRARADALSGADHALIGTAMVAAIVIPAAIAAAALCFLGRRIRPRWAMVGCCLLALMAGLATNQVHLSSEIGKSSLTCGMGFPPAHLTQLLQCAVPLAIGLWFVRRSSRPAV